MSQADYEAERSDWKGDPEPLYGTIEDGFGASWERCKADCQMEVVQCECDRGPK